MSIESDEILERLKDDVFNRLDADPFFADVPVVVEGPGELAAEVAVALRGLTSKGGKKGAMVCVHRLEILDVEGEGATPEMKCSVMIECGEEPLRNRAPGGTEKKASALVARVVQIINRWSPGWNGNCFFIDKNPVVELSLLKGQVGYMAEFFFWVSFSQVSQVADIEATVDGSEITLTTATASANIYYTTGGSYPRAENAAAELYTGPITGTSGDLLRACAYLANTSASNLFEATFG